MYHTKPCEHQIGDVICGKPAKHRAKTLTKVRYFCDEHKGAANQINAQRRRALRAAS